MTNYKQCELINGNAHVFGWIEERGAKVGNLVELKADNQYYKVVKVYDFTLTEEQLKEKQARDRNCFSSI